MSRRNQPGRNRIDYPITLSILDRIRQPREGDVPPGQFAGRKDPVEALRTSIARNLEWILNTRRVVDVPHESLNEVHQSTYMFGLDDFSGSSLDAPREQTRLKADIAKTLHLFEPRLFDIRIEKPQRVGTGTLRFQIEGMMRMDPEPERVAFDIVLDSTSGEYAIKGGQ